MKSIEVRCCCDAGKIMGWYTYPTEMTLRVGSIIPFRIKLDSGKFGTLELEVAHVTLGFKIQQEYVLKSRDYSLEELRQVRGFVANEQKTTPV